MPDLILANGMKIPSNVVEAIKDAGQYPLLNVIKKFAESDAAISAVVSAIAEGISGAVDNYGDLPDPAAENDGVIYIVRNEAGAPSGNGLYWVQSGAWAFLDALNIQDADEVPFDNSASGLAAAFVQAAIDEVEARVDTNDTHVAGDGSDHFNVDLNDTHRASDGKDHSDVVLNNGHRTEDGSDHADVASNTTHRGSDGKDHSDVVLNNTDRHTHANKTEIDLVSDGDHDVIAAGNPHSVTAVEAGAEPVGSVATHAALPTVHQDAPGLIVTHAADGAAHHPHANKTEIDLVTDGDHDAIVAGNPHAVTAVEAGAEPVGGIATHAALPTVHQDAPGLIAAHAGVAAAHHAHANQTEIDLVTDGDHDVSDGSSHSDVGLNSTHRGSSGVDHFNVVVNTTHKGSAGIDHSDVVLNNTHRGSDGSDHSNVVKVAVVQLTNAQMLALRATPITLIATPGADKSIVLERAHFVCDSALGAYTESSDDIAIEFAGGTDIMVIETTGLIDAGSVQARTQSPPVAVITPEANVAVRLINNGDGEFGGGNAANTFSIKVWYRVVDTIAFS